MLISYVLQYNNQCSSVQYSLKRDSIRLRVWQNSNNLGFQPALFEFCHALKPILVALERKLYRLTMLANNRQYGLVLTSLNRNLSVRS